MLSYNKYNEKIRQQTNNDIKAIIEKRWCAESMCKLQLLPVNNSKIESSLITHPTKHDRKTEYNLYSLII